MSFIRARLEHLIVVNGGSPCHVGKKSLSPSSQQLFPWLLDTNFSMPSILMPIEADPWLVMLTPQPQKIIETKLSPTLRTIRASVLKTITDSSFGLKFKLHLLEAKFQNNCRVIAIFLTIFFFFICLNHFNVKKNKVYWDSCVSWIY